MSLPSALPPSAVRLDRGFLAERARLIRDVAIPTQWEALNDRIPGAERSGCVHNFEVAAGEKAGEFHGLFWQDSDLAKWIEAASHRLASHPDPKLDADLDRIIATIAKAQRPDGYLNTYFQLVEPDQHWANLRDCHELYVAGHMIEAGVAHFEATGKRTLLEVVCKLADLIDRTFGPREDQTPGYCGHEEIELALVKLAGATGEKRYTDLAAYFVQQRGKLPNYFEEEYKRRGDTKLPWHMHHDGLATLQAAKPVSELTEPVGHAVRMLYLLAAMIDLAGVKKDAAMENQCRSLWAAICSKHLYIIGGVGSEPYGEKFCEPFDLPPDRAYAETCAAIGVMMCARRMLDMELHGAHADVMERALYNNVLAGVSLDGGSYFYVNPLEVIPSVAKRRYETHLVRTKRVPWFGCACCPPNLARTLAAIGQYAYSQSADGLAVHLYSGGSVRFDHSSGEVLINIRTDYPWDGRIELRLSTAPQSPFTLQLRLPGWCRAPELKLNGETFAHSVEAGYAVIDRKWIAGDLVVLELPMPVERIRADARVAAAAGQIALQRGPVVFCIEEVDNGPNLAALRLARSGRAVAEFDPNLLGGCVTISGTATRTDPGEVLYSPELPKERSVPFRAIPYALWANRGEGEMRVWLHES